MNFSGKKAEEAGKKAGGTKILRAWQIKSEIRWLRRGEKNNDIKKGSSTGNNGRDEIAAETGKLKQAGR